MNKIINLCDVMVLGTIPFFITSSYQIQELNFSESYNINVQDTYSNRFFFIDCILNSYNSSDSSISSNNLTYNYFFKQSKLHRLDGPAIEWIDGGKRWYKDGHLHRLNGPACEYINGDKSWFINGKLLSKEEYFTELHKYKTKEEIFMLRLKYE